MSVQVLSWSTYLSMLDAFLTALAKATLPLRVVTPLHERPRAQQAPCFPISLKRLTLCLTKSGGDGGREAALD